MENEIMNTVETVSQNNSGSFIGGTILGAAVVGLTALGCWGFQKIKNRKKKKGVVVKISDVEDEKVKNAKRCN